MLHKSFLPNSVRTDDRKDAKIWAAVIMSIIIAQQEIDGMLFLGVATKHALVHEQICTVRLTRQAWAAAK
jgi:hypothetical protein